jgi:hypothetical protein
MRRADDQIQGRIELFRFKAALAKKPNATVYGYSVQRHALSRHDGARYKAAAAMANGQTSEFQKQQLL